MLLWNDLLRLGFVAQTWIGALVLNAYFIQSGPLMDALFSFPSHCLVSFLVWAAMRVSINIVLINDANGEDLKLEKDIEFEMEKLKSLGYSLD